MYDFTDVLHALKRIYNYDFTTDLNTIDNDTDYTGYLTEHTFYNDFEEEQHALWYKDESNDIAIILETGEEMTEQDKAKYLY